ncbi:MAG TPA: hypothetical protein VKQ72_05325 [Aggregatilineales bacterium]|nr:hypothetical protein [Aggregatilineales bacterium]
MRRLLLLTFVLLVVFSATIRLALAIAPAREAARRDSLNAMFTMPDGSNCAMPCLLGARPGAMTIRQAADVVKAHPYVHDVLGLGDEDNQTAPNQFIMARNGVAIEMAAISNVEQLGSIFYANDSPDFTLGQILASLGEPATVTFYEFDAAPPPDFDVYLTYPDLGIEVLLIKTVDSPMLISDHAAGIFVTTNNNAVNLGSLTDCDPRYCKPWEGLKSVRGYGIGFPPLSPNITRSTLP